MDVNFISSLLDLSNFTLQPNKGEIASNNPFLFSDFIDSEVLVDKPLLQNNVTASDNNLFNISSSNISNIEFDENPTENSLESEEILPINEQNNIIVQTQPNIVIPNYIAPNNDQIIEENLKEEIVEFTKKDKNFTDESKIENNSNQSSNDSQYEFSENLELERDNDKGDPNHNSFSEKEKTLSKNGQESSNFGDNKENHNPHQPQILQRNDTNNKSQISFQNNIVTSTNNLINHNVPNLNSKSIDKAAKPTIENPKIKVSNNLDVIKDNKSDQDLSSNDLQNKFIKNLDQDFNINIDIESNVQNIAAPTQALIKDNSKILDGNFEASEAIEDINIEHNQAVNTADKIERDKDIIVDKNLSLSKPIIKNFDIPEQIQVNLSNALKEGKNEITIKLKPVELGSIDVKIELNQGRTYISIVVEKQDTLALLKQDMKLLENTLNDIGVKVDSSQLQFSLNQNNQHNSQNQRAMYDLFEEFQNINPKQKSNEEAQINDKIPYYSSSLENNDKIDIKI